MGKAKRIRTFTNAVHRFRKIETEQDLRREKLSLCDYHQVFDILSALSDIDDTASETISQSVADWFIKMGFIVRNKGIGWEVTI